MNKHIAQRDPASAMIRERLSSVFGAENVEAYRYNSASVRIRVISRDFAGKTRVERDKIVDPLLAQLPSEVERDITMVLLLTPEEHAGRAERADLLDLEFDQPSFSPL